MPRTPIRLLPVVAAIALVSFAGVGRADPPDGAPRIEFPDVPPILGELTRPGDGPANAADAGNGAPAPDVLLADLARLFSASSRSILAQMTVRRGRGVHTVVFELWTSGEDRAMLRVRAPQRTAGHAILRIGDSAWLYEPAWGQIRRVAADGDRATWGVMLLRVMEIVVGDPMPTRYRPGVVRPAREPGATWTLALDARDGADVRCRHLEVDVTPLPCTLVEARCWMDGELRERWRFGRHRDFGGRLIPTEIVVEAVGDEGWSATIQLRRFGLDVPVEDGVFSLSALRALD